MKGKWTGDAPASCDICNGTIGAVFVDGKTKMGPWANMCGNCAKAYGVGFGTGRGQMYAKQPNGEWLKVKG